VSWHAYASWAAGEGGRGDGGLDQASAAFPLPRVSRTPGQCWGAGGHAIAR